jgi:hypothetical protein
MFLHYMEPLLPPPYKTFWPSCSHGICKKLNVFGLYQFTWISFNLVLYLYGIVRLKHLWRYVVPWVHNIRETKFSVRDIRYGDYGSHSVFKILWHIDPLLGNDLEISSYTTVDAKQWFRKQAYFHGNNWTATEERCFLCGLCRQVIRRS